VLEVNSVDIHYGRFQAIKGVSLRVDQGELVGLVGSNGAGKTTLLLAVSGILKPTSGTIEFMDRRIDTLSPHNIVRMGIGHIPQGRQLFPAMTVLENLELGAQGANDGKKTRARKLQEVFDDFPVLYQRRRQGAGTLSGGEQQMLAIGRALMGSPKLLLLDEPSTGLAPVLVDHLSEIILDLQKDGLPILLVEQNAHLALDLTERAYVLQSGAIVASGRSSDLLQSDLVKKANLAI
jgi:branched-chain amino acid transport system ATP-binding protein